MNQGGTADKYYSSLTDVSFCRGFLFLSEEYLWFYYLNDGGAEGLHIILIIDERENVI